MTVMRLADGTLLLHSPVSMTAELRDDVERIGDVAHLYAPNLYHHQWIGEWASTFPSARLHAPSGLAKKRADLRIDRIHDSEDARPEPAFDGVIDEYTVAGFALCETVLLFRPANTLVVADLVHNVGRPAHGWTKFYTRAMGFYDRVGLSRMIRWSAFRDRRKTRDSFDALMQLPFDKVVVGHGSPIVEQGKEALENAFRWLPPPRI